MIIKNILWDLVTFVVALSLLITVHEFGHFWIARFYGVRVERFSIGFGKPIWKYIDQYGTEFVITLVPFGGYVKMFNEHVGGIISGIHHYSFNNKKISQRAAIITAGPIANFIFSIFVYWLVFIIGIPTVRPVVGEVAPNSIASDANIVSGMELKAIDGIKIYDWDSARLQLISKIGNNQTIFSFTSINSDNQQDKILDLHHWTFSLEKEDPIIALGIYPHSVKIEPLLIQVQKNSEASKAGLKIGDRIIRVNHQPLTQWNTLVDLIHNSNSTEKSILLDIEREGKIISVTLFPDQKSKKVENLAGMTPKIIPLSNEYKILYRYKPSSAILAAINKTWQLIKFTIYTLHKLITGNIKLNNLSGPILIAQKAGISAKFGYIYYLMFLAFISINIGVVNLFPMPILDGGHLIFLMIEKFKGKPISERIQNIIYRISFFLLMLLMGLTIFNDFSRL